MLGYYAYESPCGRTKDEILKFPLALAWNYAQPLTVAASPTSKSTAAIVATLVQPLPRWND